MKILSKDDVGRIDVHLDLARLHLFNCFEMMKGKYGTQKVTLLIGNMIGSIESLTSKDKGRISFWQKFRTPPNTPKSRRIGWHMEGRCELVWAQLPYKKEDENKLKPCPFCGNTDIRERKNSDSGVLYIFCNKCGCSTGGDTIKAMAISAWNKRKEGEVKNES